MILNFDGFWWICEIGGGEGGGGVEEGMVYRHTHYTYLRWITGGGRYSIA